MTISPSARTVWRNYETDGIPSSGNHNISKSDVRTWGTDVETAIDAYSSGAGSIAKSTRALLYADLAHVADVTAWVYADSTAAYNGIYVKVGGTGTGSWTRILDLPYDVIIATDAGAGTANAIVATSSLPVSESALILLNVFEANTASPVTVAFNGGSALTIKTAAGNDVAIGGLVAGMALLGKITGSTFRMVSDQSAAAIQAAAEAAQAAAEAAAAAAAASAASNNLPTPVALNYLRQKSDLSGYEARTPSQVASDINVQQRNVDLGFTMHSTSTTQAWDNGRYGGAFLASHRLSSDDDAQTGGSRGTLAVDRKVQGSGGNGPDLADVAAYFSVSKKNYFTNPDQGEIDGLDIFIGQSSLGDAGGILVDVEKVGGGSGGVMALESAVKRIDTVGTPTQRVQGLFNFAESPGGVSSGTGYGVYLEAQVGAPYSAVHIDQAKLATGALWQNIITACEDRNAATMFYKVDGVGRSYVGNGGALFPSYSFISDPDTGMYRLGSDQLGFSAGGSVRLYMSSGGLIPGADNTYSIGAATTGRFANAYFVNSPTIGSDSRLKKDVIDSPLGLDFILKQRPVAYRLKEGGRDIEWTEKEVWVEEPETAEGEIIRQERYFDGEKEVVIDHKEIGKIPVYDDPVQATDPRTGELVFRDVKKPRLGEDGLPLVEITPQEPVVVRDLDGTVVEVPRPPRIIPLTDTVREPVMRAVPKMKRVKKVERRPIEVERVGQRQHFGLVAQEVRDSLPEGLDFGGFVIDDLTAPDSFLSLRYEQFIAPLIRAVQELSAKVKELEGK